MVKRKWLVNSVSGKNPTGYIVEQVSDACSKCGSETILSCNKEECGFLCMHMYKCDTLCNDYTNGHICKHIHRIQSLQHASANVDDVMHIDTICDTNIVMVMTAVLTLRCCRMLRNAYHTQEVRNLHVHVAVANYN